MMKSHIPFPSLLLGFLLMFTQCDPVELPPNNVTFNATQGSSVEGSTVTVQVFLDRSRSTPTEVTFEVDFSGTYFYDLEINTPSPLVIPAGERSADITITTVDDGLMEPNGDTLVITLTGTNDPDLLLPQGTEYAHIVEDNDVPAIPSSGVGIYLTWDAATASFNDADLNFTLSYDQEGTITPLLSGEGDMGFEDVVLSNSAQDGDYYLDVTFAESRNNLQNDVEFAVVFAETTGQLTYFNSYFLASEVGLTLSLVRMTKSGNEYVFSLVE